MPSHTPKERAKKKKKAAMAKTKGSKHKIVTRKKRK